MDQMFRNVSMVIAEDMQKSRTLVLSSKNSFRAAHLLLFWTHFGQDEAENNCQAQKSRLLMGK